MRLLKVLLGYTSAILALMACNTNTNNSDEEDDFDYDELSEEDQ